MVQPTTCGLPVDRCRPVWLQPARGSILHAGRTLPGFLYTEAVPRCVVSQSKAGSGLNMRCRRTSRGETRRLSHTHTSLVRTCISRRPRADDAWCELGRSEFQGRRLLPCGGRGGGVSSHSLAVAIGWNSFSHCFYACLVSSAYTSARPIFIVTV